MTTLDEALALAFGDDARVERKSVFLSEDELERAARLAGVEIERALATVYQASDADGHPLGRAWVDTHVVRTLPESLLVVLDPDGRVERVEVLVFREPLEYLPREGWYEQLLGRELDAELALKRGIRPITGATLTARATVEAVRRVLAIDRVLQERSPPEPGTDSERAAEVAP